MQRKFDSIRFMWKDAESGGGGCPALYEVPGGHVVVGRKLGWRARRQVRRAARANGADIARGEIAGFVPANVLGRLGGPS